MANTIKVYGADWCGDTRMALELLESSGAKFDYIDIEKDKAGEKFVLDHNGGKLKRPTIDMGTGTILVEPDADELGQALESMET